MQLTIEDLMQPRTQGEKIIHALRQAGEAGLTSSDLNAICYRYSARIHDLRRDGWAIESSLIKKGLWRFTLKGKVTTL